MVALRFPCPPRPGWAVRIALGRIDPRSRPARGRAASGDRSCVSQPAGRSRGSANPRREQHVTAIRKGSLDLSTPAPPGAAVLAAHRRSLSPEPSRGPLSLLSPLPLKIVVDSVLGSKPLPGWLAAVVPQSLAESASGMLIVAVVLSHRHDILSQLRGFAAAMLDTYAGEKLVLAFRTELFQRATFVVRLSRPEGVHRLSLSDPVRRPRHPLGHGARGHPFRERDSDVILMAYVAARIDWQLALVAMLVAPLLFGIAQAFRRRIRAEWSKVKESETSSMSGMQEAISLLRVVRAFGQEDRENERFRGRLEQNVRGHLRLTLINGGFDSLIGLTTAASTAVPCTSACDTSNRAS